MNKKDLFVVGGILLGTILVALLINFLLSVDGFIPSPFSKKDWFNFWTTYSTGVFALIVGYLVITFGNKNNERVLQQQNSLLLRQENDKIKEEIAEEIKSHNRIFNIFDHCLSFESIERAGKHEMNVVQNRARLNERCINWNFLKLMYLSSDNAKVFTDEYDKCWCDSVKVLDGYLKIQLELLQDIHKADIALQSKQLYEKQHLLLTQQKNYPNNNGDKHLEEEISIATNGCNQQQHILEVCNKKIEELAKKMSAMQKNIIDSQNTLMTASFKFLSKLNAVTFLRNE